jgi:hypothetical protein
MRRAASRLLSSGDRSLVERRSVRGKFPRPEACGGISCPLSICAVWPRQDPPPVARCSNLSAEPVTCSSGHYGINLS